MESQEFRDLEEFEGGCPFHKKLDSVMAWFRVLVGRKIHPDYDRAREWVKTLTQISDEDIENKFWEKDGLSDRVVRAALVEDQLPNILTKLGSSEQEINVWLSDKKPPATHVPNQITEWLFEEIIKIATQEMASKSLKTQKLKVIAEIQKSTVERLYGWDSDKEETELAVWVGGAFHSGIAFISHSIQTQLALLPEIFEQEFKRPITQTELARAVKNYWKVLVGEAAGFTHFRELCRIAVEENYPDNPAAGYQIDNAEELTIRPRQSVFFVIHSQWQSLWKQMKEFVGYPTQYIPCPGRNVRFQGDVTAIQWLYQRYYEPLLQKTWVQQIN